MCASLSAMSPRSYAAQIAAPKPCGASSLARATLENPCEHRRRGGLGFAEQRVARPERVEQHIAVGEQVFAPVWPEAHGVGEDLQRIGFGEIGDRVEAPLGDEPVGKFGGLGAERLAQAPQGRGGEHAVHHRAGAGMQRRIDFEEQAFRPPRPAFAEIIDADAGGGGKRLPVGERGKDLLVPRHRPDAVALEPHDRAGFAQLFVKGIRLAQKFIAERVDI